MTLVNCFLLSPASQPQGLDDVSPRGFSSRRPAETLGALLALIRCQAPS